MTIRQALQLGKQQLAAVPDPGFDTAALLCHVTALPRMQLLLSAGSELTEQQEAAFRALLARRAARTPLQYLLGTQGFYGLDFAVDSRVLIPRPETETLCELALAHLNTLSAPRVLDLCTGSGAIAITLAHECKAASVTAVDVSGDALAVARENAARNQVDARFLQGDLFAPVGVERFDLIASNPPYIESAACDTLQAEVLREPRLALDGGADGLDFYRRLVQESPTHLLPSGMIFWEIGDTQAEAITALLTQDGRYQRIAVHRDLCGRDRVIGAAVFPT